MMSGVALPILQVTMSATGSSGVQSVVSYALLDSASSRSFCSPRVVELLQPRKRKETTIIATLTQETCHNLKQINIMVKGKKGKEKEKKNSTIRLPRVIFLDSFPDGLIQASVNFSDTARWPHLRNLVPSQVYSPYLKAGPNCMWSAHQRKKRECSR